MSLRTMWKKMASWVGRSFSLTDPEPWRNLFGSGTYSGRAVTYDSALTTSAVFACVKILAESVSSLPLAVYQREANGNAKKVAHDLTETLIDAPNADMTGVEFTEAIVTNLALAGNAYSLKQMAPGGRRLIALTPVLAQNVEVKRDEAGAVIYRIHDRGKYETFPAEKIWHVRGFGPSGLVGLSPIGCARQAVGLSLAAEEFGARFFGQGATTSGVIELPTWLKAEQRKEARDILQQKYEGLGNSHRLMLLEGGMKFSSVQMPLEDAQFLETRRFQVNDVCRVYRVPPHMVADLERATFSNIEHLSLEFVIFTLMPWLRRIEASCNRWLLSPADRARYFVRFNVDALLRGDSAGRASFYATMLQNGVYSRNEVRRLENMNTVDGLDDYTVQSNMTTVDKLGQAPAAPAVPAQEAEEKLLRLIGQLKGEATGANVAVLLPEDVRKSLLKDLRVPQVEELGTKLRRAEEARAREIEALTKRVEEALRLARVASLPRKPVFDASGELIGSVPVESLH